MTVENGNGLTDSNSYVDITFADSYFSERGETAWANFSDEEKEKYLIRATDYIDNIFQWYGQRQSESQALRFPRKNLYDYEGLEIEGVPNLLKQAVCDAALILSDGTELFESKNANGNIVSETIGSLSFSYNKNNDENITGESLYECLNTKLRGLFRDTSKKRIVSGKVMRV